MQDKVVETKKVGERTQHTPGPWEVGVFPYGSQPATVTAGGFVVAHVRSNESDARLIAAAPDLLEACKKVKAFIDDLSKSNPGFLGKLVLQDYAQYNEAMIQLPAAIAKAKVK